MNEQQDTALIPRFGKTVSREEYKLFKSLSLAKKYALCNELTGLLIESIKFDNYISAEIIEELECMGFLSDGMTGQFKFLQIIENAKRGDRYYRLLVGLWDKETFHLSQGGYEHPAIRKYRYFLATEKKKPRQPNYEIELRNRQIAQNIYNARNVTSLIPFQPYTDPTQIDKIEQADNQGLTPFLEKLQPDFYAPHNELDPSTLRPIYKQHRRALIICDLVYFAKIRALSDIPATIPLPSDDQAETNQPERYTLTAQEMADIAREWFNRQKKP